jgi:hypothetical protein
MKKIALTLITLSASAIAATSFSGSGVVGAKTSTGTANIPSGSLALLVVDIDNDGFLGMGPVAAGTLLTATNDPSLLSSVANLTAGSLFGGDRVLTVTTSGSSGSVANLLPSQDISAVFGKNFAVIWFDGINTLGAPAQAPAGSKYGIARGNDWTFPIADVAGALTFNSTDNGGASTLWQVNTANTSGVATGGFMTTSAGAVPSAASFTIGGVIPEPSTALLGAIGALGLLRRRRA